MKYYGVDIHKKYSAHTLVEEVCVAHPLPTKAIVSAQIKTDRNNVCLKSTDKCLATPFCGHCETEPRQFQEIATLRPQ